MGFMISKRNCRYGMRAFCDYCGKEAVAGQCNVLANREIEDGGNAKIFIACKVDCTESLDPYRKLANQELDLCVLHLINNAKIDLKKAAKDHAFFDNL